MLVTTIASLKVAVNRAFASMALISDLPDTLVAKCKNCSDNQHAGSSDALSNRGFFDH